MNRPAAVLRFKSRRRGGNERRTSTTKTSLWTTRRDEKKRRLQLVSTLMNGRLLPREKLVESLEALIAPGDRIVLEGDNQKQADFLSRSLV
jgi:malonate decarboxylase alpha subunit